MNTTALIAELDAEIAALTAARHAVLAIRTADSLPNRPGRPRKAASPAQPAPKKRRAMSGEARARIAAAQKARWAKQKREAK